jgi:hydrogenase maturation protease
MTTDDRKDILVLALGNEQLKDDGLGLYAGRALDAHYRGRVDVVEAPESSLGLLDHLVPYRRVLVLDAIQQGEEPGTIKEFGIASLAPVPSPSPHYIGLPMAMEIARRMGLPIPDELVILAMEVEDPFLIEEGLTEKVARALPAYVDRGRRVVDRWLGAPGMGE